ncbi:beta-lactamase class A [Nonomuraea fuscirosea]|uniref:Beta-lactamase class A n=1 Tax=Nonomuraea fuscirosea TaxID=1291556 RepID=A0A2T0MLS2_9ACTN|nr:serine hydrolase [Nonomuraea fuscirosea]PRX58670.1 beta-lactamase class A [Nonomuraea fuscirosea]
MNTRSKPVRLLATAAMAVTMTACVSGPAPVQANTAPTASPTPSSTAPQIPGTPAGKQLSWLFEAVPRAPIADDELAGHFTADFLKAVPPAQINQIFADVKGMRLERIVGSDDSQLVARVVAGGTPFEIVIVVDGAGLMTGLQFREPVEAKPAPKSWAEVDKLLRAVSPQTGFLAAELTGKGRCVPAHTIAADRARPLGSMIKLYVLGTVADRIERGAFGWDTQLTIKDELKSLPTGKLQDRPDGSKVSVLEAAKLMISISDNTATDLLIHKVGRKAVERTMRAWGVRAKGNVPLLTTRDLFALKGADYPRLAKRYLSLSPGKRQAYLEQVVARTPLAQIKPWTEPRELDTIEYFASPSDICRAYGHLVRQGDKRVGEALSINDAGLGLDEKQWPTVWFKGGSEAGLSDLSFLARTKTGKTYVVTTMAVDPTAPITDQDGLDQLVVSRAAFTLLTKP